MSNNIKIVTISVEELEGIVRSAVLEAMGNAPKETLKEAKKDETPKGKTKTKEEKVTEPELEDDGLEDLSYNDLKKKAKEVGVPAKGSKDVLLANIREALAGSEEDEEVEETPKTTKGAKEAKKSPESASDEEDEEEEDIEEVDAEEISEEEITEVLTSMNKDELLEVMETLEVEALAKWNKAKAIKAILELDLSDIVEALSELGYFDEVDVEEDEIDEVEDEEPTLADDLNEFDEELIKEACKEFKLSVKGKKQSLIDRLVKAVDDENLDEDELFDFLEGDEESADGEDSQEDDDYVDLEELSDEELEDYCEEYNIEAVYKGKGKKKKLNREEVIEALEGLVNGSEEDEDEEDEDEDSEVAMYTEDELADLEDDELLEVAEEFEVEAKYIGKGKKKKLNREAMIDDILDAQDEMEEEDEDEDEGEDFEPSEERLEAEKKIEDKIRADYKKKKLKDKGIKDAVVKYNEGNPDFNIKGLSKEDLLELYVGIKVRHVNDDGDVVEDEECYIRNDQYFCCGAEVEEDADGGLFCSVCGTVYSDEQE